MFRNLDRTQKLKVKFGDNKETQKLKVKFSDNKEIQVEEKGIVAIKTSYSNVKLFHNVYFVLNLACGYSVLFDDEHNLLLKIKNQVKQWSLFT